MTQRPIILHTEDGRDIVIPVDDRPKLLRALTVFGKGFSLQMVEEGTLAGSAIVGLAQGMKYKGDVKRGILSGLIFNAVVSTFNGIRVVVKTWDVL